MKQPPRKHRKLWHRILGIVGALLALAFAVHPELRVLAPFLDALGLDALIVLMGAQVLSLFAGALRPVLFAVWRRLAPWLSAIDRATRSGRGRSTADRILGDYSGVVGQYLWAGWGRCWRLACLGPGCSLQPVRSRGAA